MRSETNGVALSTQPRNRARPADLRARRALANPHIERDELPTSAGAASPSAKSILELRDFSAKGLASNLSRTAGCDGCGDLVSVCVLEGYVNGAPQYRRFCSECDSRWIADTQRARTAPEHTWLSACATVCMMLGAFLGLAAILADEVVLRPEGGFGFWQQSGVALGLFVVALGGLLRLDSVSLTGLLMFALSLSVDLLGPMGGFSGGRYQRLAGLTGAVLLALSMLIRAQVVREGRRTTKSATAPDSAKPIAV